VKHALLFALLLTACGDSEPQRAPLLPPMPAGTENVSPDPGAPVRTVGKRNPFGHTQIADNLVADGDFELTGRYGQMPWQIYSDQGQGVLNYETGGRCLSGVRCLKIAPREQAVGFVASPKTGRMSVSIAARALSGKCSDARVAMLDLERQETQEWITISGPDETGWCRANATLPGIAGGAPVLYLELAPEAKEPVIFDDAVVLPAPPAEKRALSSGPKVSRATMMRFARIAEWIKVTRVYGRVPARPEGRPLRNPD
jgi:hypothetical protein